MNKLKNILVWVSIIAYLSVTMSFIHDKRNKVLCSDIKVAILDSASNGFITVSDIKDFFHESDMNVIGAPINSINTKDLEKRLKEYSAVKNSEVYVTVNGEIWVEVDQRNPILRVINKKGRSYYIDQEGSIMPLSSKFSSHILVANGNIVEPFEINRSADILCEQNEETVKKSHLMCDLYQLSKFIYEDDFWRSQIEQIYVNDEREFELVPRVGAHIIYLGDIENYQKKFRNLKAFYLQGLNNVGWNKYDKISLKFENQIICTKR